MLCCTVLNQAVLLDNLQQLLRRKIQDSATFLHYFIKYVLFFNITKKSHEHHGSYSKNRVYLT